MNSSARANPEPSCCSVDFIRHCPAFPTAGETVQQANMLLEGQETGHRASERSQTIGQQAGINNTELSPWGSVTPRLCGSLTNLINSSHGIPPEPSSSHRHQLLENQETGTELHNETSLWKAECLCRAAGRGRSSGPFCVM